MKMYLVLAVLATLSSAYAGYSDNTNDNKVTGGYGYGYSGSFSGGGLPPNFPQFPNFDFQNFLQQYIGSMRRYHEQLAGSLGQLPGAFSGYGFPGGVPSYAGFQGQQPGAAGFSGSFPGGEGAAASAAFGPEGVHQTAAVYPENPNSPNINTRFAASPGGEGPGFHSVSTSSFSGSSNDNGKPSSFHQASTTVNDNGKVTTYTVRKP